MEGGAKGGDGTSDRGVFVRNLAFDTTSSQLEETFESVGPIKSCFVVTDPGTSKSRGYGIVQFAEADDAVEAVRTLNGKMLRGRAMQVEAAKRRDPAKRKRGKQNDDEPVGAAPESEGEAAAAESSSARRSRRGSDSDSDSDASEADDGDSNEPAEPEAKKAKKPKQERRESSSDSRCVVLKNVPAGVTDKMLYKRCKKISPIEKGGVTLGTSGPGTADVIFVNHKDAHAAVSKLNGKTIKNATLSAVLKTRFNAASRAPQAASGNTKKFRLIIRNLPFTCTEKMLRKACSKHGPVSEVTLVVDAKTSKPKGFAFVQYRVPADAANALKRLNGKPIGGRTVAVDWALSKSIYEQHKDAPAPEAASKENDDSGDESGEADDSDERSENETGDEDEEDEKDEESEDDADEDQDKEDDEEEDDDDDDDDEEDSEDEMEKSSDVNQGRTLFIRNVSFDTKDDHLAEVFAPFGKVELCKIVRDEDTGRSRGSAFVKFAEREHALAVLDRVKDDAVLGPLECSGRALNVAEAVDRRDAANLANSNAQKREEEKAKAKKDTRNLYLLRQGIIMNNSPAYAKLSKHDQVLRAKLERESKAKIAIPNLSVSKTRVSVHNMPLTLTESELRKMVVGCCKLKGRLLQSKIVRSKDRLGVDGKPRSKGFGFLEFQEHEDALAVIAAMNNSPKYFDPKRRPIMQFAWVDIQVIKTILRRRELSRARVGKGAEADEADDNVDPKRAKLLKRIERRKRKKEAARLAKADGAPSASEGASASSDSNPRPSQKRKVAPKETKPKQVASAPKHRPSRMGGLVTLVDEPERPTRQRTLGRQKRDNETDKFDVLVEKYRAKLTGAPKSNRWA